MPHCRFCKSNDERRKMSSVEVRNMHSRLGEKPYFACSKIDVKSTIFILFLSSKVLSKTQNMHYSLGNTNNYIKYVRTDSNSCKFVSQSYRCCISTATIEKLDIYIYIYIYIYRASRPSPY